MNPMLFHSTPGLRLPFFRTVLAGATCGLLFFPLTAPAQTVTSLAGDHHITEDGSETGHLTLDGGLSIGGNALDFGTTGTNLSALSWLYGEDGSAYTLSLSATRDEVAFYWRENAGGTVANKMKLDASNVLSLYDASGNIGLSLSPLSGITLPAGRSLTLADGTVLSGATSLRQTALFDSGGTARAFVDGEGNLVVGAPLKLEGGNPHIDFGGNSKLDQSNVAFLGQALGNLGYAQTLTDYSIRITGDLQITSMSRAPNGEIYLLGNLQGEGTLNGVPCKSVGPRDCFLAKVSSSGGVAWIKVIGGTNFEGWAGEVEATSDGGCRVGGRFVSGQMELGVPEPFWGGNDSVFVLKVNQSGVVQWGRTFHGIRGEGRIAVDSGGNSYAVGWFYEELSEGFPQPVTNSGMPDAIVVKINTSGEVEWAVPYGGSGGNAYAADIAVSNGSLLLTGYFYGTIADGLPSPLVSAGDSDVYVLKMSDAGVISWAIRLGGEGYDEVKTLAVSSAGTAYIAGSFYGNWGVDLDSEGESDVFVASVGTTGSVNWISGLGGISDDYVSGIALGGNGGIYICGSHNNPITSGLPEPLLGSGGFLVKMNDSGSALWAKKSGIGWTSTVITLPSDKIFFSGEVYPAMHLGGQILVGRYLYSGDESTLLSEPTFGIGGSKAAAPGALAIGSNTWASSLGSVAIGHNTMSRGNYSLAAGESTISSGISSTAFGSYSIAAGHYSTAYGLRSVASGYVSTAYGGSTASGFYSTAFGWATASGSLSLAAGNASVADGDAATALGISTKAPSYASLALGRCNVGLVSGPGKNNWEAQDSLLEVGNGGSDDQRRNALTLFKNSTLRTAGKAEFKEGVRVPPQGDLSMGAFTAGQNPADLDPTTGLRYESESNP